LGTFMSEDYSPFSFDIDAKKPEYLKILDENGVPTGELMDRREVHRLGKFHAATLILIFDSSGRLLMQQRAHNKDKFPDMWDVSIACHVLHNELPLNAGFREAMEELNFSIDKKIRLSDFVHVGTFVDKRKISDDFIENQFYNVYALRDYDAATCVALDFTDKEVQACEYKTYGEVIELLKSGQMHPRNQWFPLYKDFLALI